LRERGEVGRVEGKVVEVLVGDVEGDVEAVEDSIYI
jgi:hypothetical protein